MKILLINHSFPPALTPRAFRWGSIARHWADEGHVVDVICGAETGDAAMPAGVRLHRIGKPRRRAGNAVTSATVGLPRLKSALVELARRVWRRIYWPDATLFWVPAATRAADALATANDYDLLISSSHPFSGHLVGLAINRRHPALNWLVDVGDPFSFADGAPVNNFALYGRLNRRTESELLAKADTISVTTEGTRDRYVAMFPFIADKISVIPPLLPDTFQSTAEPMAGDGRIRLVFVGTLYGDIRSPAPLLRLFERLLTTDLAERLELHFYGVSVNCDGPFAPYAALMGTKIFRHGLVSQQQAAAAMRAASVLINIGNSTEYQLPSKVVEYAAMAKPILNFILTDADSSKHFFAKFAGILSLRAGSIDDDAVFDEVATFLLRLPEIDIDERREQIASHTPARIAQQYPDLARAPMPASADA